jgi:hypothetical protein
MLAEMRQVLRLLCNMPTELLELPLHVWFAAALSAYAVALCALVLLRALGY